MSDAQLERSVLEAKERDELLAIADALGTKPASRAKKADLIAQILRATGVETDVADPAEKPRRTRARKASAPESADGARPETGEAAEQAGEVDAGGGTVAAADPESGDGRAPTGGASADSGDDRTASDSEPSAGPKTTDRPTSDRPTTDRRTTAS